MPQLPPLPFARRGSSPCVLRTGSQGPHTRNFSEIQKLGLTLTGLTQSLHVKEIPAHSHAQ